MMMHSISYGNDIFKAKVYWAFKFLKLKVKGISMAMSLYICKMSLIILNAICFVMLCYIFEQNPEISVLWIHVTNIKINITYHSLDDVS